MNVFLNEPIHNDAYSLLSQHFQIINDFSHIGDCEVIISRNLKLNKELLSKCHALKLIAIHGSGYDDVDIEYAKNSNIHLLNTPGQNALSVAELNVALALEVSRHIYNLNKDKKNGSIQEVAPIAYMGNEMSYKTAGFIGYGQIAKKTIDILKYGFHMNINVYSPHLTLEEAHKNGINYYDNIDDIFKTSDYIFICCSLNENTYHMINKSHFNLMKPTAYLINTARGAIVNQDDLYQVLLNKKIAGAGLDVIEGEPVSHNHPLLTLDNVIYTSHMGASTDDALKRVGLCLVEGIIEFKKSGTFKYLVF